MATKLHKETRKEFREKVNLADEVFKLLSSEHYDFFSNLEQGLKLEGIEYTDEELAFTLNELIRENKIFIPSVTIVSKKKRGRMLTIQRISRKKLS